MNLQIGDRIVNTDDISVCNFDKISYSLFFVGREIKEKGGEKSQT